MTLRLAFGWLAPAAGLILWSASASASADFIEDLQSHLYAGKTAAAAEVARDRLDEAPDDDRARFALGAVRFLQAVEHLGQGLHRYGLASSYSPPYGAGLSGLPILRLPVPPNPDPEQVTYGALRDVLQGFIDRLRAAEAALASVAERDVDLPLNIARIHLDLNADGVASDQEALWRILQVVMEFRWIRKEAADAFLTDFDRSDVPWLRAYCHLLMAIAEFPLAHDWQEGFEQTFHGLFPDSALPNAALVAKTAPTVRFANVADFIAFVHLTHWPVVEPERMRSVLQHLEAMVRLSRETWTRVQAETDDRGEWIPNPGQTGVLPRMTITQERIEGWRLFLEEFDALLQGRKLVPHWRFDQGINLRRIFTEPTTFDPVLLIQGSAALPYLEDGDSVSGQTWNQISRLFAGRFFRYFVWLN